MRLCAFLGNVILVLSLPAQAWPVVESKDGWLNYTLRVAVTTVRLPFKGISFQARTYNGMVPGPTLRVKPGDRVRILIENRLEENNLGHGIHQPLAHYRAPNSTNLHIHGIYQSSANDNTFESANPGDDLLYEYSVDARTGTSTLWYHPHLDGSSSMQLYGGMAGSFEIVDPKQEAMFDFAETRTMVLQLFDFDPASKTFIDKFMSMSGVNTLPLNLKNPEGFSGQVLLSGGEVAPQLTLPAGRRARLKLINALSGSAVTLNLGFVGGSADKCQLHVLAYDGVYLKAPRLQRTLHLPSGGKADVAVTCLQPGKHVFGTTLDGVEGYGGVVAGGHSALELHVQDSSEGAMALPATLPGPPAYYPDLLQRKPDGYHSVLLGAQSGANIIDGWPYNGSVSHNMRHGSMQEWNLFGGEGTAMKNAHPYHQHVTHFQIVEVHGDSSGLVASPGDYRDTVPLYKDLNFTVRFVAAFQGLMMVHCHVLKHEDLGMMTLVNVLPALANSDEDSSTIGLLSETEVNGVNLGLIAGLVVGGLVSVLLCGFATVAIRHAVKSLCRCRCHGDYVDFADADPVEIVA